MDLSENTINLSFVAIKGENIMSEQKFFVQSPNKNILEKEWDMFVWESEPNSIAAAAHIHDQIELLYVTEGSFIATVDGRPYELAEGDLILFCSNAIHHVISRAEPRHSYYCLQAKSTMLPGLSHRREASDYTMRFALNREELPCLWKREELEGSEILSAVRRLVDEYEHPGYATEISMKCRLAEVLLSLLRDSRDFTQELVPANEMTACIYRALIHIRQHFKEELEEAAMAKQYGISYSYFSRQFKQITGMSFKQYLNSLRIHYAEQLLLTSRKSVTEIAGECGYNNTSYFISMYKRLKGETPKKTLQNASVSKTR